MIRVKFKGVSRNTLKNAWKKKQGFSKGLGALGYLVLTKTELRNEIGTFYSVIKMFIFFFTFHDIFYVNMSKLKYVRSVRSARSVRSVRSVRS